MDYAAIIKERVSAQDIMDALGVPVNRRGMAKCPFHADKDASLKVYQDAKRGWHCYGCHAGGDALDFVKLWYGVGLTEAIHTVNDMFTLGLPLRRKPTQAERKALAREIRQRRAVTERRRKRLRDTEAAYWAAYDQWLNAERIIDGQAPQSPQEPMSEEFIWAVVHRSEIREALEIADENWRMAREQRNV